MRKLENNARRRLQNWLDDNTRLIGSARFDKHNHVLMYSVAGHPVIVLDMYSKKEGDYQGFEVFIESEASSISDCIDELEELQ